MRDSHCIHLHGTSNHLLLLLEHMLSSPGVSSWSCAESFTFTEMGELSVEWLASTQGVIIRGKVRTSRTYDGRLLRRIAVEAGRFGRGT